MSAEEICKEKKRKVMKNLKIFSQYLSKDIQDIIELFGVLSDDYVKKSNINDPSHSESAGIVGSSVTVEKVLENIGSALSKTIFDWYKTHANKNRIKELEPVIKEWRTNNAQIKKEIIKTCVFIFRSYEMIFMNTTVDGNQTQALKMLADEAAKSIFDFFVNENIENEKQAKKKHETLDLKLMLHAITTQEFKEKPGIFKQGVCSATRTLKGTNPTLQIDERKERKINSVSVYTKPAIICYNDDGTKQYYRLKDQKIRPDKYGYRLEMEINDVDKEILPDHEYQFPVKDYIFILKDCDSDELLSELMDDCFEKSNKEVIDDVCEKLSETIENTIQRLTLQEVTKENETEKNIDTVNENILKNVAVAGASVNDETSKENATTQSTTEKNKADDNLSNRNEGNPKNVVIVTHFHGRNIRQKIDQTKNLTNMPNTIKVSHSTTQEDLVQEIYQ